VSLTDRISAATVAEDEIGTVFTLGGVIGKSASIYGRYFGKFVPLTAAMALPEFILLLTNSDYAQSQYAARGQLAAGASFKISLLFPVLVLFLGVFAQGVVLRGAYMAASGGAVDMRDSFSQGLRRAFSLMAVTIMQTIGVAVGLLLLVVPGLILSAMLYVALSACVIEGLSGVGSLNRSAALTRGHRWKVFGIVLLTILIPAFADRLIEVLIIPFGVPAWAIAHYVEQVLSLSFEAVLGVVVYHDLRAAKEGLGNARIATVFD